MKKIFSVIIVVLYMLSTLSICTLAKKDDNLVVVKDLYDLLQSADPTLFSEKPSHSLTVAQQNVLKDAADKQIQSASTDREKIFNLYNYVSDTIYYDEDYINVPTTDAYGVYIGKKTICQGYAELLKTLCYLEKIPCRIIYAEGHSYNAAYDSQNKHWIVLDSTWHSSNRYKNGKFIYNGLSNAFNFFDMSAEDLFSLNFHEIFGFKIEYEGLIYYVDHDYYSDEYSLSAMGIADETVTDAVICSKIKSLSVTSIANSGFAYCTKVKSIEIPSSVTVIYDYAFSNCQTITSINIPYSVNSIGKYAFTCCYALNTVTLGKGIKTIGDGAFRNCHKLNSVNYCGSQDNKKQMSISASDNNYLLNAKWIYNYSLPHTHTGGEATCVKKAICTVCGEEYGSLSNSHIGGTATCKEKAICDICHKPYGEYGVHKLTKHNRNEADHFNTGNIEYWTCDICEKYFADKDAKNEITQSSTVIEKIKHSYSKDWKYDSTEHWHVCSGCSDKTDISSHTDKDINGKCDICGALLVVIADATGDGVIDAKDLTRLKKYFADKEHNEIGLGADCTGDGKVDAKDLTRLKKYLADKEHTVLGKIE